MNKPLYMSKPLMIDLYAGLGGWAEGFLTEGYDVIGFDIERHDYGTGGYPGQLVLQDVLTLHGRQLKDATVIVASPPCQEFSYMAMPWSIAKEKQRKIEASPEEQKRLTALFDTCFRLQREASEAAGHHIPMVVENVRGAQKWVGRCRWHYGSFYLWGDVPALMPIARKISKIPGFRFDGSVRSFQSAAVKQFAWNKNEEFQALRREGYKTEKHLNIRDGHSHTRHLTNPAEHMPGHDGIKQHLSGSAWFDIGASEYSSKSSARKAASAMIAKIPPALSRHIARAYYPKEQNADSR
jgi:site-specific DNA-cytosine methylase